METKQINPVHDQDLSRDEILTDIAYILFALAQNYSGETRSEIGILVNKLLHIRSDAQSAVLAASLASTLEEARSHILIDLEAGRVATAQAVWQCYEQVMHDWEDA